MAKPEQALNERKSLRFQYIMAASIVSALLLGTSFFSNIHFKSVLTENTQSLNLHTTLSNQVDKLESLIWKSDKSLYSVISSSEKFDEKIIVHKIVEVKQNLEKLKSIQGINQTNLLIHIERIDEAYQKLNVEINNLLTLSKDVYWLYPMLPFINSTLLESNTNFETAMEQAIKETLSSSKERYTGEIFQLLESIRNTWRLKILDFRGSIIRFAGLHTKYISQEENIQNYHDQLTAQLAKLNELKDKGVLGFETEIAADEMLESAKKWYADYLELLEIRKANVWRKDIQYIETIILPLQKIVFDELSNLKNELVNWSLLNTQRVEQAAEQINIELWVLTFVAIIFIIVIYRRLEKSLLIPVKDLSQAISVQSDGVETILLPPKGSKEINILINSFNTMRRQIHHRQMALEFQAMHDSLTGLPNRALLQDRLEQAIHQAERNDVEISLLLLDLDRFKDINDTLGHPIGDKVLREIAKRLEKSLRVADTVARLGGDEFAVITSYASRVQIEDFVKRIVKDVERVITIDEQKLSVGVSVGIATFPIHGNDADTLIRHADVAMYSAKRDNKDQEFYALEKDYHTADNLTLLADLKTELKKPSGQIKLYFQPEIDIATLKIVSVEALIRWRHPIQGDLPAEHIIRLAEQSGLIAGLTSWVITEAFSQFSKWNNPDLSISINLSVWNLQDPNLISFIKKTLDEDKIQSNKITLEITESAVMNDPVRAREVLTTLSEMGIQLAIDDYGTGFSSLAYLKLLPVKYLKIDKSFVIDMLQDENDSIIVRSTIELAHNLGLSVIAEGVEDEETLEQLRKLKCDFAQGYYIAKPMSSTEILKWIDSY